MNTTQQILEIVQAFNKIWVAGEFKSLGQYLHPDVVFVNTAGVGRVKGYDKCIAAFSDFTKHAHTKVYDVHNEKVEMWGKTAVASYEFAMVYQLAGRDYEKKGRDILVFNQQNDEWKMVYRTLSPY
jgi:ketosteroid isomerase-like protein